jgi:signal transduction histidine kinase
MRREPVLVATLLDAARHGLVFPQSVTFEVAVVPTDLTILCDPILLERVLSNMYLNSIEALEERGHGTIVTRAWLGDARTYLEVEDDGPGLDASVIDRIFEPLVTAKTKGTGLGLALCRIIIEAHGGEVTATTGSRGGSAFRMWLPNA